MANIIIKKNFVDGEKLFAQQLNNNFETIEKGINDGNKIVWQDGNEVKFKRYVTNDINDLPIQDGAIIYDIEKGAHYADFNNKRIVIGGDAKQIKVSPTEPATGEEVWIDNINRKIYVKNDNGVYECIYGAQKIGDIYITSTNENPSSYLGGTWELVDKDFIQLYGDVSEAFTPNADNVTFHELKIARNNETLRVRLHIGIVPGVGDGDVHLGTIDYTKLGITGFQYNMFSTTVFFDTGDTLLCMYIGGDGSIIVKDTLTKSGDSHAPGVEGYIDWQIPVRSVNKLDSTCDKFYWKRTS